MKERVAQLDVDHLDAHQLAHAPHPLLQRTVRRAEAAAAAAATAAAGSAAAAAAASRQR